MKKITPMDLTTALSNFNGFMDKQIDKLETVKAKLKANERDFLSSDYCTACGGKGWRVEKTIADCPAPGMTMIEKEQCESCEELHRQELQADRLMDESKGN